MSSRLVKSSVHAKLDGCQANCMAIDCWGKYALIAGRKSLAFVDLELPNEHPKKSLRQSKWDISALQWSPHETHGNIFVTACNQQADLSIWQNGVCKHQGVLKAHTRVISDVDWSPLETYRLLTCSVDTYTHVWDMGSYHKPLQSFQAVAGVSQAKWNKINQNILATTHDGNIRIWDLRIGSQPAQYIAGHLSKIYGLDWSPHNEYLLATCSQDSYVKLWDYRKHCEYQTKIPSASPVWRARYTPFGDGLVTVVVPQLRRGENSLCLWHLNDVKQPVYTFEGHTDVILEFHWHKNSAMKNHQLVTWSKDHTLRGWKIEPELMKMCGHEGSSDYNVMINSDTTDDVNCMKQDAQPSRSVPTTLSPDNAQPDHLKTSFALKVNDKAVNDVSKLSPLSSTPPHISRRINEVHSPHQYKTLKQEFSLVNLNMLNVQVDQMDAKKRMFSVTSSGVNLNMIFPEDYPNNTRPQFSINSSPPINTDNEDKLLSALMNTADQHVKHQRSCIEPCLRTFDNFVENLIKEDKAPDIEMSFSQPASSNFHTWNFGCDNNYIPFPRTSGARFCGPGYLVCFTRYTESKVSRRISTTSDITPRDMASLSKYPGTRYYQGMPMPAYSFYTMAKSPPEISIGNFYSQRSIKSPHIQKQRTKIRGKTSESRKLDGNSFAKKQTITGPVIIYDTTCLLPVDKQLAENYSLDTTDISATCSKNAGVASSFGREDLAKVWSLASLITDKSIKPSNDPDDGEPWSCNPFGRKLIKSLMEHFKKMYDIQTLAMICCVFQLKIKKTSPNHPCSSAVSFSLLEPPVSAQDSTTAIPAMRKSATDKGAYGNYSDDLKRSLSVSKIKRSNSWSELSEDHNFQNVDPSQIEKEKHEQNLSLLDRSLNSQYDVYIQSYAELLYQWQLWTKRAEVLKFITSSEPNHIDSECHPVCNVCNKVTYNSYCSDCQLSRKFRCSICRIPVKACGHGGHSTHITEWFLNHDVCASGCGCYCLENLPCETDYSNPPKVVIS